LANDINYRSGDSNLPVEHAAKTLPPEDSAGVYPRHRRMDKYSQGAADQRGAADLVQGRPQRPRYAPDAPEKREEQNTGRTRDSGFVRQRPNDLGADYMPVGDEDEPACRRRKWPVVVLALLLVIALCVAGLYTVLPDGETGIIGTLSRIRDSLSAAAQISYTGVTKLLGIKPDEPAAALSFETPNQTITTGSKINFAVTTSKKINNIRLLDVAGKVISDDAMCVNAPENTTWSISLRFDNPFIGDVYLSIMEKDEWNTTDKKIAMAVSAPTATPTAAPTAMPTPTSTPAAAMDTADPFLAVDPTDSLPETTPPTIHTATAMPTETPIPKASPTTAVTPLPTAQPTVAPTQAPTATPTPKPTVEPTFTPEPTNTPMPVLTASADPDAALVKKSTETVYTAGASISELARKQPIRMAAPDKYVVYKGGVFAFRGDSFRRNAAYGTAKVERNLLSVLWKTPLGSLRTGDGTLYGVGWTGQPAIVKWAVEVRHLMNLKEEKKNIELFKEVIFAAQDGKIYFLDMNDGTATRDPIDIGFPLRGSVAIDPSGRPMLAVGQAISKLSNKTGDIGLYIYNLLDQTKMLFINGRQSKTQSQYTTNGAFDGSALIDHNSDNLIVAGENGLLYTVSLNPIFDFTAGHLEITAEITALKTKADAESTKNVGVESSIAVYDKYIYMADTYGILRCVDSDTMKTVWAVDTGDNTDASIALDFDGNGALGLYTGNTAYARLGNKKDVTIRRLDAMTGAEVWSYGVKCAYDKDQMSGCKASPVIGQNTIKDLVIFTVNQTETGAAVIAFDKTTGAVVWTTPLTVQAISSPVAVYNKAGDAWIIQADMNGRLYLMNARTGMVLNTLDLGGEIQGSPAVYNDVLVIGTCSKDNAYMYGIRIE
jgi:outer membrane protein assembly factor BamB